MKSKLFLIISFFFVIICNAQTPPTPSNESKAKKEIFTEVDQMPDFPGGTAELIKYLKQNTKIPEYVSKNNTEGKVLAKFIVNTDGTLSDIGISMPFEGCKECDEEAIRVIKSMPNWIPGKQNGKVVAVRFNLPLKFAK